jgi:SNF2 family DNA or RNA helicase
VAHADLDTTRNRITIRTEYRDRERVRALPGARWHAETRLWTLPVSWTSCRMLRAMFGETLTVSHTLATWARTEHAARIQPALEWHAIALDPEIDAHGDPRLYPFQRTGVAFLTAAGSAILADEMGTGKTVQTILTLENLPDAYPALVVCPASVKASWAREFATWAPGRTVAVIAGTAPQRRKQLDAGADVVIINYDAVRSHSRLAAYGSIALTDKDREPGELNTRTFATVVADEAHRLKDPKSKQTRAVKATAAGSRYRYALTGTPIANRPDELWSLLNFIAPDEWPSLTKYVDRYCHAVWNGFGTEVTGLAPEHAAEFYSIIDPRFLRRPKSLVLPQLPPKVREIRDAPMTPAQSRAYRTLQRDFLTEVDNGTIDAATVLVRATRLAQLASAVCDVTDAGNVRMVGPSNKVAGLLEVLDELGPDEPVVVFAEHRQLIDLTADALTAAGITYGRVTGAEDETQRAHAVDEFQNGNLRAILLTLGAGGVGITLTAARVAVFLERSWSLVNNRQAEDRIHRIGQTAEAVLIIDLVAPDTIETARLAALDDKDRKLEEIVRDGPTLAAYLRKVKP